MVNEVNFSQNQLDDEDLDRICERLSMDKKVAKVKLGNNNF
jgi:hypothetical protein